MSVSWVPLQGILARGHRVASGPSKDYPYGALERQRPIFKSLGLNLDGYFNGTLNVNIQPYVFEMLKPEFTFYDVQWTDLHPPEHFSFSRCKVMFREMEYAGWVYYPHPETKIKHFQNPSLLEVVAQSILGVAYGDSMKVFVNPDEILVKNTSLLDKNKQEADSH